jgi:poly(glycerol-phosphate) alpha-glucosyltransferase
MGASVLVSPRGMLDPWALRNSSWKKRLVGNAIEYRFLRDVDCFHALNVSEARSIREFGVSKPICVIPNGTTLPDGVKVGSGLAEPKRRILFLGRIHPKKGIEDLLKAWALLKKDHNWMLTIAGWDDGGHLNAYRELTDQLGCADSVEWFGSAYGEVKDRLFRSSSAFILPSYSEGLPMSIIEAMSYGLLVLMTPECNIPEAFNAGAAIKIETGYCGIQAGLDQMLAMSDAELIGLGGAGRLLVEKSFTWDQQVLRMQGVYDWMLGNADEPDCMFDG